MSTNEDRQNGRLLIIRGLYADYGGPSVLSNLSMHINTGEIVGVIGPNGAGKSTLCKCIYRLLYTRRGEIVFDGSCINTFPPHKVVKAGIAYVPEGKALFSTMSLIDNLMLGTYSRSKDRTKSEIMNDLAFVFDFFAILKERKQQLAGSLSGGEQQMLAIARGLMARPKMMVLDEPFLGLAPLLIQDLMQKTGELRLKGITILLCEQNSQATLRIADRVYVIANGEFVAEGSPEHILLEQRVKAAYLGKAVT
jgi:branched-chain amino acid transport system ATP-binding protein